MNTKDFNDILTKQIARCTGTLVDKAKEYATADRLHNFKVAAALQNCTPERALSGMMAKHTVSIFDMCESGKEYPLNLWNEKISDHVNYLFLLRAIVEERAWESKNHNNSIVWMEAGCPKSEARIKTVDEDQDQDRTELIASLRNSRLDPDRKN